MVPFTLAVFILGGAEHLEMALAYFALVATFATFVSMIMSAASLAIAFGPIKDGIYVYFAFRGGNA